MRISNLLFLALTLLALIAAAQSPVINSFSPDGAMVCTNLAPGSVATVVEAPTVTGPWAINTDGVPVTSNGTFQLSGLISATGSKYYRVRGVAATNSTTASMVLIPAGSFTMGDAFNDYPSSLETPAHSVYVSSFCLDKYDVTKALWDDVYNWAVAHG